VFGRPSTRRNGESVAGGYPQILVVYLNESGTHAIREALIRRATGAERPAARALLKDVGPGDFVYNYSFEPHAVKNPSDSEPAVFLCCIDCIDDKQNCVPSV
jgi:uncharacterized RmlC-like cupin family protein